MDLLRQPGFKKSLHVLTLPCFHGAALLLNDLRLTNRNDSWLVIKPERILNTGPQKKDQDTSESMNVISSIKMCDL